MKMRSASHALPVLLLYNLNATWPAEDIAESVSAARILRTALQAEGHPVTELCLEDNDLAALLAPYSPEEYIVFNWCEEIPGIQHSFDLIAHTLEELGYTFTGAGSDALAFSQDKRLVKQRLTERAIQTPAWQIFTSTDSDGWHRYPAIVKPALEHCSYGVTREAVVWTAEQLARRVDYVLESFHQPALVEEFIDGRELHVSVLGNGHLHVLPAAEMDFSAFANLEDRLCSYESKFDPRSEPYSLIKLRLPAALSAREEKLLEKIALASYRAVGCRDYARLDIRLQEGRFYILDINPNADLSPDTSLALAAELAGLSYGRLGSLLVNLAALRHPLFAVHVREDKRIHPTLTTSPALEMQA